LPEGTLDPTRLAALADAIEDAGCTDADLLGHLRGPGPHVRGVLGGGFGAGEELRRESRPCHAEVEAARVAGDLTAAASLS
jgi:hypothetical protein